MPHEDDQVHPVDRTLEYSRPLRALKLWLAFTVHGADAIRAAVERNLQQATLLAELLDASPQFEVLAHPQLSAVCFRVPPPPGADPERHNAGLLHAVNEDGKILLAAAEVDGIACLRACIVNHRTTDDDVRAIPAAVAEAAAALEA
jgi:aromatic-L-amino-acid decarboxylase